MSLDFENMDDFDPEKTQSFELEEYGVWVKKETPEITEDFSCSSDIFNTDIFNETVDSENEEIQLFNDSKKQWAGNSNLYMPYKNQFPNGQYELIYKNADEKFQKSKVNLKYDSAFYEKFADEIPSFMESKKGKKQIAIFDKENKMIYFGEQDEELKNNRAIWLKYKDAAFYKEIWTLSDNSVMCILPKKDVVPE